MGYEYEKQQDLAKKFGYIQYVNVENLLEMRDLFYPNADEVKITFTAEYNDESGCDLRPEGVFFYNNSNKEEIEVEFGNDEDGEDNYYDLFYDLVERITVSEDFDGGEVRFDFEKMAFII